MFHWFVTLSEKGIWKEIFILAEEYPTYAFLFLCVLVGLVLFAFISHTYELYISLFVWLPTLSRARKVTAFVLLAVTISVIVYISFYIRHLMAEATMPVPLLTVKKSVFVGNYIVLSWTFDKQGYDQPVFFEIEGDNDNNFPKPDFELATDSIFMPIEKDINGSRYWRVRAIKAEMKHGKLVAKGEMKDGRLAFEPLSRWSSPVQVSQYKNAISRIESTCHVTIYVADSFEQGIFRFMNKGSDDRSLNGFDIKLANHLASRIQEKLKPNLNDKCKKEPDAIKIVPVPWTDLLESVGNGSADLAISAITKRRDREERFRIMFSNPYYCTSQVIMWVGKKESKPLNKIMFRKQIGVPVGTTSEDFVNYLRTKFGNEFFEIQKFSQVQEIVEALTNHEKIDYGIVDEPFARSVKMRLHTTKKTDFNFRKINKKEYPAVDEEYAVAVGAREDDLLGYVNQIIKEMTDEGLKTMYSESVHEYRQSLSSDSADDAGISADACDFRASCNELAVCNKPAVVN